MKLSAVVLAGGRSTRMGCDKAWLTVDGQPLITRVVATLRELDLEEVFISGRPETDYSSLQCSVLLDREPGLGPVAGIEQAMLACTAPLLLVLAVDMPKMTAAFLRILVAQIGLSTGTVPVLKGQVEPLAAIYPRRCQPLAVDCLAHHRGAARHFASACLRESAVRVFPVAPAHEACFENWNSPSDTAVGGAQASLYR